MMHIVFCTDVNYVMPTGIAMISICENNQDYDISFHIIRTIPNDSSEGTPILIQLKEIALKYNKEYFEYLFDGSTLNRFGESKIGHISLMTFARLFISEILPSHIEKVLYLDGDLIVDKSVNDLWNIEINNYALAACEDANGYSGIYHRAILSPMERPYFNAGVLLINLNYWREKRVLRSFLDSAEMHLSHFGMMDQDILNYVLGDNTLILPIEYNYQTIFSFTSSQYWMASPKVITDVELIIEQKKKPTIIHYIAANKPWKNEYCPFRQNWDKYKFMSIWKDEPRQFGITRFDRSNIYQDFIATYWMDAALFNNGLKPYLRFFQAVVKLKNKSKLISISSAILNFGASLFEKIYSWKTRKQ